MDSKAIRDLQAPLKEKYKKDPESALITLKASGKLEEGVSCKIETGQAMVKAGLHPATGGSGMAVCSGDMLLEALVACAGVTLNAVSTAIDCPLKDATISAEGDLDFRGTLGVSKEAPVGFKEIRLHFDLKTEASDDQIETLLKLTERYCVVYQTLVSKPSITINHSK
ncbi:OsmC family protein [Rhodohalobacter sp. 614A]|uniref:OsmC family protein n=1 Tax=Rhodohalobacter sp. 614A TaxID=2908649 RepID=UPI001F1D70EC|nr:OsmC family protein [Rhodohalobacter sp. 614A]